MDNFAVGSAADESAFDIINYCAVLVELHAVAVAVVHVASSHAEKQRTS